MPVARFAPAPAVGFLPAELLLADARLLLADAFGDPLFFAPTDFEPVFTDLPLDAARVPLFFEDDAPPDLVPLLFAAPPVAARPLFEAVPERDAPFAALVLVLPLPADPPDFPPLLLAEPAVLVLLAALLEEDLVVDFFWPDEALPPVLDVLADEDLAVEDLVDEAFDPEDFFVFPAPEPDERDDEDRVPCNSDAPVFDAPLSPLTDSAAAPIAPTAAPVAAPLKISPATSITLSMMPEVVLRDRELFEVDDFEPDEPERLPDEELLFFSAISDPPNNRYQNSRQVKITTNASGCNTNLERRAYKFSLYENGLCGLDSVPPVGRPPLT